MFYSSLLLLAFFFPVNTNAQQTKDGYNKLYYPNGKISSEGTIREGKPDGYWKNYYENGKLKSEGNRKDFKLDSLWKFYTEKGLLYLIYTYREGKKNGFKYTYQPQLKDSSKGILSSKECYVNDTLEGSTYTYRKGKLFQIKAFKGGLAEGISLQFNTDSLITSITIYKGGFIKKVTKINQVNTEGHKEGLWQTFYSDLTVKWEGTYTDGKRDGYFKTYDEKGELLNVEKYINDVLQLNPPELAKLDIKTTYYSNGNVESTGPYKDNLPFGEHRVFNEDGAPKRADIYDSGRIVASGPIDSGDKQEGDWKEYFESGQLKDEGEYQKGLKVGEWKYYFMDGKKFEVGKYDKNGKQTGQWLWYYDDGKIRRESTFSKGQEDGNFIEYNDSGTVITKGQFEDGLKEGDWIYQLGNYKSFGKYSDDMQDSTWTEYYNDNGHIRFTGKYNQDRPDGEHVWYYEDGKKEHEGRYNLGLKEDKWKFYTPDGVLFITITYRDDVEVKYDAVNAP
jgi:antitoxin component YwqK of YwqJK toxin-antitoxin module